MELPKLVPSLRAGEEMSCAATYKEVKVAQWNKCDGGRWLSALANHDSRQGEG